MKKNVILYQLRIISWFYFTWQISDVYAQKLTMNQGQIEQIEQRNAISLSFASQNLSSAIAEKLVQLSREGGLDVIDLTMNLDGAINALSDGLVDGAFSISHLPIDQFKQKYPHLNHHEIAYSFVTLVSKNNAIARETDIDHLAQMIEGKRENWADGRPFILYLRPTPDAFEMAWRGDPRIDQAFEQARKLGKWKLIENEEILRNQLKQQQYTSTLYDTAHLKLFALPVWQIQPIRSSKTTSSQIQLPKVYYYFSYMQQNFKDSIQKRDFQRWLDFITGPDYSMIQDFGWLIQGKEK